MRFKQETDAVPCRGSFRTFAAFSFVLSMAAAASGANAALMTFYNDEAGFNAATSGLVLNIENFDGETPMENVVALNLSDLAVVSTQANLDLEPASTCLAIGFSSDCLRINEFDNAAFTINFPNPVTAFAFVFNDFGDADGPVTSGELLLSIGGLLTDFVIASSDGTNADDNSQFFGLLSTTDSFASITLRNTYAEDNVAYDDVRFAEVSSVPVPATLGLMALALTGMRRRAKVTLNR